MLEGKFVVLLLGFMPMIDVYDELHWTLETEEGVMADRFEKVAILWSAYLHIALCQAV